MSNNLAEEFNVEDVQREIKTFKEIFNEIKEIPNPDQTITAAIEKAAIILDLVHHEMENEGTSARMAEVAAQLINTIIQSSSLLHQSFQTVFDNKVKQKTLEQKDRELDIKEVYYDNKKQIENNHNNNNNIIVTDTNSILKFLENKKKNEC